MRISNVFIAAVCAAGLVALSASAQDKGVTCVKARSCGAEAKACGDAAPAAKCDAATAAACGAARTCPMSAAGEAKAQALCPVIGGKVDKKIFADHEGKRGYFCCAACIATFKKDPARYVKDMESKGIVLDKTPDAKAAPSAK